MCNRVLVPRENLTQGWLSLNRCLFTPSLVELGFHDMVQSRLIIGGLIVVNGQICNGHDYGCGYYQLI